MDPHQIGDWQSCRRLWRLNRDWRRLRWHPKRLFDALLRDSILKISNGTSAEEATAEARVQFMQSAANPGLDISTDPYRAARDWCALLEVILRVLVRHGLPMKLAPAPTVKLNSLTAWEPSAFILGAELHRWITIDSWNESDTARELHSWRVMGDIAIVKLPMQLHVIEIGQIRDGRRVSSWTRAWKHPGMPSLQMRFKKKDGGEFTGYKPFYLVDHRDLDVDAWVEQLWREGTAGDLLHDVQVRVPSLAHCTEVQQEVLSESAQMRTLELERVGWRDLPMSRNHCDTFYPCSFQEVCYSDGLVEIEKMGLYQTRSKVKSLR